MLPEEIIGMIQSALPEMIWLIFIYGIVALGLNLILGHGGMFHLGQIGFFVIGGMASTIVMSYKWLDKFPGMSPISNFVTGIVLGVVITVVIALAIGLPTLRLRGDYFAIATLGFGEIVKVVLNVNDDLRYVPVPKIFQTGSDDLNTNLEIVLAAAVFVAFFIMVTWLTKRPFGRVLHAVRDDELGAESLGKNAFVVRLKTFIFGAAMASIAGSLYVHHFMVFSPMSYLIDMTVLFLVMVVLGGLGNNVGTVLGVILVVFLSAIPRWFTRAMDVDPMTVNIGAVNMLIFAGIIIAVMILHPPGILGEGSKLEPLANKIKTRLKSLVARKRPGGGT
jgi:branched-chain amino acid transport system permease protein